MPAPATSTTEPRAALTRHRVVDAGIRYSDAAGLEALTMRGVAGMLGVAPMSLYRHVPNKDHLLDAMIDVVFSEIVLPLGGADWKSAMRDRAISLMEVLRRHRWAVGLMESRRRPGPANLRHHDAVIGKLRAAGFEVAMVAHAYSLLDSYIYGFAATTLNVPYESTTEMAALADEIFEPFPRNEYPNLSEFVTEHVMQPNFDHANEFEYGLDLILAGLERGLSAD